MGFAVLDLAETSTTDAGLTEMAANRCPLLQCIDLSGCRFITASGVQEIITHSPRLRILGLAMCPAARGSLFPIAHYGHNIEKLNLASNDWVTAQQVISVLDMCMRLTWIDIRGCVNLRTLQLHKARVRIITDQRE